MSTSLGLSLSTDRQPAELVHVELREPDVAVRALEDAVHDGLPRRDLEEGDGDVREVSGRGLVDRLVDPDDVIIAVRVGIGLIDITLRPEGAVAVEGEAGQDHVLLAERDGILGDLALLVDLGPQVDPRDLVAGFLAEPHELPIRAGYDGDRAAVARRDGKLLD